jgi:hypothetical protein
VVVKLQCKGTQMFVLRTMSQNFNYVAKYLQMGGRILKPFPVNIKKNVKFVLPLCFTKQKKKVDILILGKERDNIEEYKFSLLN